MMESARN